MTELSALCVGLGFENVRTYIQSGNVVFKSSLPETEVQSGLEKALAKRIGKSVNVMVRTTSGLRSVLKANPFPEAQPATVAVVFLPHSPPKDLLDGLATPGGEEVRLGGREIYIHYPKGMGQTKLRLPPAASAGTARNINTVTRLLALAEAIR